MIRTIANTLKPIPLVKESQVASNILEQYNTLHEIADPNIILDAGRYFNEHGVDSDLLPAPLVNMLYRFFAMGFLRCGYVLLQGSKREPTTSLTHREIAHDFSNLPKFCVTIAEQFSALGAEFVDHNPHWAVVGHVGHPIFINADLDIPTLHFVKDLYESSDRTVCSSSTVFLPIDAGQPLEFIRVRRNKVIPELCGNPNDTYIEAQVMPLLNGKKAFSFLHRCSPWDVPRCHISTIEPLAGGSYELCGKDDFRSLAKDTTERCKDLNRLIDTIPEE